MVESLDDAIGTLLDAVDESGAADRTVVIFTSDNGGNMYNGIPERDQDGQAFITAPTSNRPLRGGKATMYEGGIRVPTIVAWPGVTKAAGRSDQIIQSSDFYPTLLAGLGLPTPRHHAIDGIDILPALKGGRLNRAAIFTYFPHAPNVPDWLPPSVAAHAGDWKLIRLFHHGENGGHDHRLYNLKDDLGESRNLASLHPEKVRELDRLIEAHLREVKAVRPKPNPRFDPKQYHPDRIGQQIGGLKVAGQKRSPAKKTVAPPLHGWRAGGTATLAAGDGALMLRSTGGDPQLVLADKLRLGGGPFTVSIRLKSTRPDKVLVFGNPPFKRGGFKNLGSVEAGRWTELSGRFDEEMLTGLRFDPLTGVGSAEIEWVRVADKSGKRVKEWAFPPQP